MPGFGEGLFRTVGPALQQKMKDESELKMTQKLHDMQASYEQMASLHEKIYDARQKPESANAQEVQNWVERYKYEEEKLNKTLSGSKPLKELWGKVSGVARKALMGPQKQQAPQVVPQDLSTSSQQPQQPAGEGALGIPNLPPPRTGGGVPQPVQRGGDVKIGAPDTTQFSLPPPHMMRQQREQEAQRFKTDESIRLAKAQAEAKGEKFVKESKIVSDVDGKTHIIHEYRAADGTSSLRDMGVAPETQVNKKSVLVRVSGQNKPVMAFVNPRNPQGYVDVNGNPLADAVPLDPNSERLYSQAQVYNLIADSQLRRELGREPTQDELRERRGALAEQAVGTKLSREQQIILEEGVISGVGGGPGLIGGGGKGATGSGAPAQSQQGPTSSAPKAPTQANDDDILYYMGSLMGTQKGSSKGAQVRSVRGQQKLAKLTGLDPVQLNVELAGDKALTASLAEAYKVAGAFQRVQETIKAHGQVLIKAAQDYDPTGSPIANRTVQWVQENVAAHPELTKYTVALAALQREYSRLIAGGVQSRAMLPVSSEEKGEKILRRDATMADIAAAVEQLKIEADTEQGAFTKQQEELKARLSGGKVGQAVSKGTEKSLQPPATKPKTAEEYLKSISQ